MIPPIAAHYGELGLPSDVPTRLKVARIDWDGAYAEHTAARQAAAAARRSRPFCGTGILPMMSDRRPAGGPGDHRPRRRAHARPRADPAKRAK
ncbi:MAG: hypothetical protein KAY37_16230 [Phycisphaerae bacterium]|nr:hypothetical protein [Phycisphaerae bacterium]